MHLLLLLLLLSELRATHQEECVRENGENLPASIVQVARDTTMYLSAARFERQVVAAMHPQAIRSCAHL